MPTPSQMQLPKSKSANEFEDICCEVLSTFYKKEFQKYGRLGQNQGGIDLYADQFSIVAQCKNYFKTNNILNKLKSDYECAKKTFNMKKFIAMTALDRDTNIQSQISQVESNILIFFWDDIQNILCSNPHLLKKFYPSLILDNNYIKEARLNKIIRDLVLLKRCATQLHDEFFNYRLACNEECDNEVYHVCAEMFTYTTKLYKKLYKCYIQLNKYNNLGTHIEEIIRLLPDFHNAHDGYCEMICTIQDFLSYFQNDEKYNKYIFECQKTIDMIQKTFN